MLHAKYLGIGWEVVLTEQVGGQQLELYKKYLGIGWEVVLTKQVGGQQLQLPPPVAPLQEQLLIIRTLPS